MYTILSFLSVLCICTLSYGDDTAKLDALKKKTEGKGHLKNFIHFSPLAGTSKIKCEMSDPTVKNFVNIDKLRDCSCDCSSACDQNGNCPRCDDPNTKECTDEVCTASTYWCDCGVCISQATYDDDKVDCDWHCVENKKHVHRKCVEDRDAIWRITPVSKWKYQQEVVSHCGKLLGKGLPFDCKEIEGSCPKLQEAIDVCKSKKYAQEGWFTRLEKDIKVEAKSGWHSGK